jgi:ribulose-phosphate 3-epimerase
MYKIAPSILSADFSRLDEEIKAVEKAGADMIHVDVMDGHFVPNITIGPGVVASIRKCTKLPLDVHLMIDNPDQFIPMFKEAGADIISVHPEVTYHLDRTLRIIKESGAKACLALNPSTSLFSLDHIWEYLDMILVMSVNPGFGGQKFIPQTVQKVQTLRKKSDREKPGIDIEVDGGISAENIKRIKDAGANVFVAGHAVFKSNNYAETIKKMKAILNA